MNHYKKLAATMVFSRGTISMAKKPFLVTRSLQDTLGRSAIFLLGSPGRRVFP